MKSYTSTSNYCESEWLVPPTKMVISFSDKDIETIKRCGKFLDEPIPGVYYVSFWGNHPECFDEDGKPWEFSLEACQIHVLSGGADICLRYVAFVKYSGERVVTEEFNLSNLEEK